MTLEWLISWWNLIFIVPFLLALLYLGLYTISGVGLGANDAGADAQAEMDAEADAPIDADAEGDAGGDVHMGTAVHAEVSHPADVPAHVPFVVAMMSWMGLGRVPLTIWLTVLLISWGVVGFLANRLAYPALGERVAGLSVPLAAILSALVTRLVSHSVARWTPPYETYAHRRHELLGCDGEAVLPIGSDGGVVAVRDDQGDLFQVPCRVYKDGAAIAKGQRVRLVAYNGKDGLFYVMPSSTAAKKS